MKRPSMTADDVLARIGDDPQTLVLAIQLLERMRARRLAAKRSKRKAVAP